MNADDRAQAWVGPSLATLLLQTNNVFKRSRNVLIVLLYPDLQRGRKEVWVYTSLETRDKGGGCTVLYMIPPLRPGTVHDLYCPRCLIFSSLLDFLWMPPVQELQLMKTNIQWHFPSGNDITWSSAHLWYRFLVDTSVSGIHDICSKLTQSYYQSESFPDHL